MQLKEENYQEGFLREILTEEKDRVFAQVKTIYIKDLPFVLINKEEQKSFIEKVDQMLLLNRKFHSEKENFLNSLNDHKGLQKISKRLENFNEMNFQELIKELAKQKIRFALGEENNKWREYFKNTKQKISNIQNQIYQTEKEINKMVYQLYELTGEECEFVENTLKYQQN